MNKETAEKAAEIVNKMKKLDSVFTDLEYQKNRDDYYMTIVTHPTHAMEKSITLPHNQDLTRDIYSAIIAVIKGHMQNHEQSLRELL